MMLGVRRKLERYELGICAESAILSCLDARVLIDAMHFGLTAFILLHKQSWELSKEARDEF
jgi:hypothetical protein